MMMARDGVAILVEVEIGNANITFHTSCIKSCSCRLVYQTPNHHQIGRAKPLAPAQQSITLSELSGRRRISSTACPPPDWWDASPQVLAPPPNRLGLQASMRQTYVGAGSMVG